ncbi:glycosyl hydrolase [Pseudochryseolinea flava]|nr:glycosyl hydrolase [Pseudochryseolinea flava]
MKYFSLILFALTTSAVLGQGRSEKRGLSYGEYSALDLEALAPGVSWIYNWHHQPKTSVLNSHETYDMDFIPMAWNGAFNKEAMRTFIANHPKVKYILGFNEPNFKDQANMTPTEAAAKWPEIEAIADEYNLEIVGPAVNYCGNCVSENGTTYNDPFKYLDDFFAACPDCRVDHIAIHCYMNDVNALKWYVGEFKKYDRPIWLTEFAAWEGTVTLEQQKNFMFNAINYLESDPDVFRYAWFTGRFENKSPFIGILSQSSASLTALGEIYVNTPVHDPTVYSNIPGILQTENYSDMSGVKLELTNDQTGVINVSDISANDWTEYKIDVPEDNNYQTYARIAGINAGSIEIMEGSNVLATITFTSTGSYQTWDEFPAIVPLTAGEHTLRLKYKSAGFKLNWLDFKDPNILSEETDVLGDLKIYPNPSSSSIQIEAGSRWHELEIMDVVGKKFYHGQIQRSFEGLSSGTYLFKFVSQDGRTVVKKIIRR